MNPQSSPYFPFRCLSLSHRGRQNSVRFLPAHLKSQALVCQSCPSFTSHLLLWRSAQGRGQSPLYSLSPKKPILAP